QFEDMPLEQALQRLFEDQPFTYELFKNSIIIKPIPRVAESGNAREEQQEEIRVNGLVVDSTGAPLTGVSVVVKGSPIIGTTTDLNGRYVLEVPEGAVLVFSMIGFATQEIPVGEKTIIDVTLLLSLDQLDNVVVVAFGTQKKKEVVGAVTTITPSELKVPSSNLTTALAGRLAG